MLTVKLVKEVPSLLKYRYVSYEDIMRAFSSLRSKIVWLNIGVLIVLGFLLVMIARPLFLQKLRMELIEKGEFMAKHLAISSAEDLLTEQYLRLKIELKEFQLEENDSAYVFVTNKNGEVVAHSFKNGFPQGLQYLNPLVHGQKPGALSLLLGKIPVLDIAAPIMAGSLGSVHIGLSEEIIMGSAETVTWSILLIVLLVLCFGGILSFVWAKKITKPQVNLVQATDAVGKGDLAIQTDITSHDELGLLGSAFNRMINDLQNVMVSRSEYQNQSKFLHEVLEAIYNPLYVIDVNDYSIVMANSAAGFSGEWSNKTCHVLTHHRDKPCGEGGGCECPLEIVKRTRKPVIVNHTHYDHNNKASYYEVHGCPIFDENGKLVQMIEFSLDITKRHEAEESLLASREELKGKNRELESAYNELKSAQAQMVQGEKMASIGQLAAGVAHEINNPIGFISSNLGTLGKYSLKLATFIGTLLNIFDSLTLEEEVRQEIIKEQKKLKIDFVLEDINDLVAESLEGTKTVGEIVKNLKNFSRLDDQGMRMTNINDCLESTLKIVWNELKYKATVNKEYGELPLTSCLPMELNQVFVNILVNAGQAIEGKGKIDIKTWSAENRIFINISDTGSGIAEDKISKIFEPFFTTKEVGKGTGLGMSISYDIIKKHDGKILVTSEVGKGTTFTIELPVKEEINS